MQGTDDFTRPNIAQIGGYTREDHLEDHPTGKQHVCVPCVWRDFVNISADLRDIF